MAIDFSELKSVLADSHQSGLYTLDMSLETENQIRKLAGENKFKIFTLDFTRSSYFDIVEISFKTFDFDSGININVGHNIIAALDYFLEYMSGEGLNRKVTAANSKGIIVMCLGIQRLYSVNHNLYDGIGIIINIFYEMVLERRSSSIPAYIFFKLEENETVDSGLQAIFDEYQIKLIANHNQ